MAEHNELNDGELAAALSALAPRRSRLDRERVMYLAGHQAAAAQGRRRRWYSVPMMAGGWLVAAVVAGQSWMSADRPRATDGLPVAGQPERSVREHVRPEVQHDAEIAGADISDDGARDVRAVSRDFAANDRGSGTASLVGGDQLLMHADFRNISRTGRLTPDRRDHMVRPSEAAVPATNSTPRSNFELRREFMAVPDVL